MYTQFDEFILRSMPTFVAAQYEKAINADNVEDQVRNDLRVYELCLRALSIGLITQYLIRDIDEVIDQGLNEFLTKSLPHPSLEIWQEILFQTLEIYKKNRDLFFIPELYDFYWDHTKSGSLQDKKQIFNKLTTISYRISPYKKDIPKDEDGWKTLYEEVHKLLCRFLSYFEFFEQYELIRITRSEGSNYFYDSYRGLDVLQIEKPLLTRKRLILGHFYLSKNMNSDFLNLHPLIVLLQNVSTKKGNDNETALYDSFSKQVLQYLVGELWESIPAQDQETYFDFLRDILNALDEKKKPQEQEQLLSWETFQKRAYAITTMRMASVMGKYDANLYLQRYETKKSFDDFIKSDKTGLILTGNSGIGKSNFLLSLIEAFYPGHQDVCLIMYNGAKLDTEKALTETIGEDFAQSTNLRKNIRPDTRVIWDEIENIEGVDSRKVIVCIDAINENPNSKDLLRKIDNLVESSHWPWLKIIITSRPEAWKSIKQGVPLAKTRYYHDPKFGGLDLEMQEFRLELPIGEFNKDELKQVYAKYKKFYNLQTDYEELSFEVKDILVDPLALRLVAYTHQNNFIPNDIRKGRILERFINHLVANKTIHDEDLSFLRRDLMPHMIYEGHYAKGLSSAQINEITTKDGRRLRNLIHDDRIINPEASPENQVRVNDSYRRLVDADILVRIGDDFDYEIGFKYERFYDYFAGERLLEIGEEKGFGKAKLIFYKDILRQLHTNPFLWGAIQRCLLFEIEKRGLNFIKELAHTTDPLVKDLIVDVITQHSVVDPERSPEITSLALDLLKSSKLRTSPSEGKDSDLIHLIGLKIGVNSRLPEVMVAAAFHASANIRAETCIDVRSMWFVDREFSTKVLTLLSSKAIQFEIFPNFRVFESLGMASALIVFDAYQDVDRRQVLFITLQNIWQPVLKKIFKMIPGPYLKESILRLFLPIAIRFLTLLENPSGSPGMVYSIDGIRKFFPADSKKKKYLEFLIPHLQAARKEVSSLESKLSVFQDILFEQDLLVSYLAWAALMTNSMRNPVSTAPIIRELWLAGKDAYPPSGNQLPPPLMALMSMIVLNVDPADMNEDFLDIAGIILKELELDYRGRCMGANNRIYQWFDPSGYTLAYESFTRNNRPPIVYEIFQKAVARRDIERLKHYLTYLRFSIFNISSFPDLALELIGMIIELLPDAEMRGKLFPAVEEALILVNSVAQERVYNFMDNFSLEQLPDNMRRRIRSSNLNRNIDNIMQGNGARFVHDILKDPDPAFRDFLAWWFQKATEVDSFDEWVILLVRRIVWVFYGEDVFLRDN